MVGRAGTLHASSNAPFVEPTRIRQLGPYNGGIQPPCFCVGPKYTSMGPRQRILTNDVSEAI